MYKFRKITLLVAALTGLSGTTTLAEDLDINKAMSAEEFEAAGLHKLTSAELRALARWISEYPGVEAAVEQSVENRQSATSAATAKASTKPEQSLEPEQKFGREQLRETPTADVPESIASRVVGEFRGWNGSTVFKLENGQVWRQRVGGKYRSPARTNPEVIIERGRFGYYLKVIESGRSVAVKRIR